MRKLAPYIFIFVSGVFALNFVDSVGLAWLVGFITWGLTDWINDSLNK